jgi:AbrB family looped-hinge helix DNA binding protein
MAKRTGTRDTVLIGKRGQVVIPLHLRKALRLGEGDLLSIREDEGRVVLERVVMVPAAVQETVARAALSNARSVDEYIEARKTVRAIGLDPGTIQHDPPKE